jgi:hypothetical protein
MSSAERFRNESLSLDLFDEAIRFKNIYFARSWAHYETAVPGTLHIMPNASLQTVLRRDYQQMQEMFPSEPLSFDEILVTLERLQHRINTLKKRS